MHGKANFRLYFWVAVALQGGVAVEKGSLNRVNLERRLTKSHQFAATDFSDFVPGKFSQEVRNLLQLNTTRVLPPFDLIAAPVRDVRLKLRDMADLIYTATAEVGTPPRKAHLVVDTGSSDIFLLPCTYDFAHSSTAVGPGGTVLMSFGSGQVEGTVVKDNVCFGSLCAAGQSIVQVTETKLAATTLYFDGLLGLGFPAIAKTSGNTFLQSLDATGGFDRLAFGITLQKADSERGNMLIFGNLSSVLHEADRLGFAPSEAVTLQVTTFSSEAFYWMIQGSVTFGFGPQIFLGTAEPIPVFAALDSGTTLIAVPQFLFSWVIPAVLPDFATMCANINLQIICRCDVDIRPMTFNFVGREAKTISVTLSRDDLLEPLVEIPAYHLSYCRFNMQPAPPTVQFWILGDVFMRKIYAVHDVEGKSLSLFPPRAAMRSVARDLTSAPTLAQEKMVPFCLSILFLVGLLLSVPLPESADRERAALLLNLVKPLNPARPEGYMQL